MDLKSVVGFNFVFNKSILIVTIFPHFCYGEYEMDGDSVYSNFWSRIYTKLSGNLSNVDQLVNLF